MAARSPWEGVGPTPPLGATLPAASADTPAAAADTCGNTPGSAAFVNEHSANTGEAVELAGPTGTDLTGQTLVT